MERKKIIVASSYTPSLMIFRLEMIKRFQETGYQVVTIGNEAADIWEEKFKKFKIEYNQLNISRTGINPFSDLKALIQLKGIFKKEKPCSIFLYNPKTVIYGCIAAKFNKIYAQYRENYNTTMR